jgi:hypothetical protein
MITWIIESNIYNDNDSRLVEAAKVQGNEIIRWDDGWILRNNFPTPLNSFTVFHGSLGNASQITSQTNWKPGAFCTTKNFYCSAWYSNCKDWLIHKKWTFTTVSRFVENPELIFEKIEADDSVFVRPDSPLKPFSGRVVQKSGVTLKALDYGYYYDDENLPIVIAPLCVINKEWRFIVVKKQVVTGSAYIAESRYESFCISSGREWEYAQVIANNITSPDDVYVLDLCESAGNYKLLELNPFSGADLYGCDRTTIVKSMLLLANQAT